MRTVEIRRVVDPVVKWDPRREGAGTLTYIDPLKHRPEDQSRSRADHD